MMSEGDAKSRNREAQFMASILPTTSAGPGKRGVLVDRIFSLTGLAPLMLLLPPADPQKTIRRNPQAMQRVHGAARVQPPATGAMHLPLA
jgi:hypothetical protein